MEIGKVVLVYDEAKKHSHLYKAVSKNGHVLLTSAYVMKDAMGPLGAKPPKAILITIEEHDGEGLTPTEEVV